MGRGKGCIRHNHFIRWKGIFGRGKVGRNLGGLRHNHFIRWVGMVGRRESG